MRIANPDQVGNWTFHLEDPDGEEIVIPPNGVSNSIDELLSLLIRYISEYDNATNGEYSKKQRELASQKGVTFTEYLRILVNHQMCLRHRDSIKCWSDGMGDNIHNLFQKVADFKKAPDSLKSRVQQVIASFVPGIVMKAAGCAACGGSSVMKPKKNNLGRADKLNK